jgi:hypothetical protein
MSQYYLPTNGMQISQLRCYARWNAEKSQSLNDKLNTRGNVLMARVGDLVLSERETESRDTARERAAIRRTKPVHSYMPTPPPTNLPFHWFM